jgi:hypothetical protein
MTDFDQFWQAYPRRIGKIAARKAFDKAIKNGATLTQLLAGIGLYLQYKPVYADYCHPASWLNAGRWMDEWADPVPTTDGRLIPSWFEECKQEHNGVCESRYGHFEAMKHGLLPCQKRLING